MTCDILMTTVGSKWELNNMGSNTPAQATELETLHCWLATAEWITVNHAASTGNENS